MKTSEEIVAYLEEARDEALRKYYSDILAVESKWYGGRATLCLQLLRWIRETDEELEPGFNAN